MSNMSARSKLLKQASAFSNALVQDDPPPTKELLQTYFTADRPRITEHGPKSASALLPFVGKTFEGRDECIRYFDLMDALVRTVPEGSPPPTEWAVDEGTTSSSSTSEARSTGADSHKGIVTVAGQARLESIKTGRAWNERFIYRFSDFDEEGRIGHWEIWADILSTWWACGGGENPESMTTETL